MTPAAGALLGLLGSGVNLLTSAVRSKPSIEGASFDELLSRAKAGTLREGEPIRLGADASVELTGDQLERLGEAAAELEKAGAQRAVILLDGMAIEYDVMSRTVLGSVDLDQAGATTGIDAFVRAPAKAGGEAVFTSPSFGATSNASLLRALGGDSGNSAA